MVESLFADMTPSDRLLKGSARRSAPSRAAPSSAGQRCGQEKGRLDGMDVELTIRSVSDGGTVVQKMQGVLYAREGKWFYRYREPESEMGRVVTLLRVEPDLIRLLRQGDIQSEQQFRLGRRLPGYYDMAHGRMELDADTREMRIELEDGLGIMEWAYDLYVSGEQTGSHRLSVEVTAAKP